MAIEKAADPTSAVPGTYLSVNLKGSPRSPGSAPLRGLVLCPLAASGASMAAGTLQTSVPDADAMSALVGLSTPGHLFAKAFFKEHPLGRLDVGAASAGGGMTATATATFSGTVTEQHLIRATVCGRIVDTHWAAGEAATIASARLATKLEDVRRTLMLPTIHSVRVAPNAHVMDFDAAAAGAYGNDISVSVELIGGAGGNVAMSGSSLSGGTLEPNYAALLALIENTHYDYIAICVSNAEAASIASGSNPDDLKSHINGHNTGLDASLQSGVVGVTGLQSAALLGADAHNEGWMQYVHAHRMQSLGCEFAGAEMGQRMRERALFVAKNRIKMPYRSKLYGVKTASDKLGAPEINTAILGGLTPITQAEDGTLRPHRPVTTYHEDSDGNPDDRIRDTTIPDGCAYVALDLAQYVEDEFPNKSIIEDQPPGAPPIENPDVVEIGEVRAAVDGRMELHITAGVVNRVSYEQAKADGEFAVQIDGVDDTQVNIVVPFKIVSVHAKTGIVLKHVA